jgi:hypothetical protein
METDVVIHVKYLTWKPHECPALLMNVLNRRRLETLAPRVGRREVKWPKDTVTCI